MAFYFVFASATGCAFIIAKVLTKNILKKKTVQILFEKNVAEARENVCCIYLTMESDRQHFCSFGNGLHLLRRQRE